MTHRLLLALCPALLLAGAANGQRASRPFTVVETGQGFAHLGDAVSAIGDGDGTIRIAPGRYRDCAVQEGGRIAFVAETQGTAVFDAAICEGKATLVLRGRASHVEGLVFTHMRVEDGNGAGIRIEQGDLTVAYTASRTRNAVSCPQAIPRARFRSTIPPSAGSASIRTGTAPIRSMSAIMAPSASPIRASSAAPAAII